MEEYERLSRDVFPKFNKLGPSALGGWSSEKKDDGYAALSAKNEVQIWWPRR